MRGTRLLLSRSHERDELALEVLDDDTEEGSDELEYESEFDVKVMSESEDEVDLVDL